jgi:putative ABC transport system substrate-binding protein
LTRRGLLLALIALAVCLASFGLPSAADAQQPASPRRIGVLLGGFSPESKEAQQFRQGLLDAGYAEGRDVVIEWRSASGDYARVPALVAELVQHKVDVIVVTGTPAAQAAKQAAPTIPVVMAVVADPVGSGLVANLAHPGGNITGLSQMTAALSTKRLQLLKETLPRATRVAVFWNPDTPFHAKVIEDLKIAAPSLSIELQFVGVRKPGELGPAFSTVSRANAQALYVIEDTLFFTNRGALLKLASRARLPIIYGTGHWGLDAQPRIGRQAHGVASTSRAGHTAHRFSDEPLKPAQCANAGRGTESRSNTWRRTGELGCRERGGAGCNSSGHASE